jgi:UDP-N-acetylglucosamine 4,6-dehydratase (inverting)
MDLNGKTIFITGATGSFGKACLEVLLREHDPKIVRVFSRDELKQSEMQVSYRDDDRVRFFLGDVRDRERLIRATHNVDLLIHAAALKQVPACEYNPFEAIQTNINGTKNVIDAAIDQGVERVIAISTDKAVNPINLYGATKLCAEKLIVQANVYGHPRGTVCAAVRYGNVIGSRGSVIPLFRAQRETGKVTVTDRGMTRFWIRLEQGVEFAIRCAGIAQGGEIFIPKIPSLKMMDLVETIAPGCRVELIGIRPGEKLHEILISEDESRQAVEYDDMFVLEPIYPSWSFGSREGGKRPAPGFRYSSDTNEVWFSRSEMLEMADG